MDRSGAVITPWRREVGLSRIRAGPSIVLGQDLFVFIAFATLLMGANANGRGAQPGHSKNNGTVADDGVIMSTNDGVMEVDPLGIWPRGNKNSSSQPSTQERTLVSLDSIHTSQPCSSDFNALHQGQTMSATTEVDPLDIGLIGRLGQPMRPGDRTSPNLIRITEVDPLGAEPRNLPVALVTGVNLLRSNRTR